jgi:ParB-like chromosome segregation protein Spo0J
MTLVPVLGFTVHPAAELFPLIDGAEFEALVADIREHGLMEPVVVDAEGRLIDGRNRARACERLGIRPTTKTYDGDNVTQFVVSHNLHRRHLTDSQRAMIAAKLATRKPGYRDDIAHRQSASSYEEADPGGLTLEAAASLLSVSASSIQKAKIVDRAGTEDLVALVTGGHAPVATAARVAAELSPAEQNVYVEKVLAGADPVKVAPPDLKQKGYDANRKSKAERPPATSKPGPNRRKHLEMLDAWALSLAGHALILDEIQQLDTTVTPEEAQRLDTETAASIQAINRIRRLLKERTT